MVTQIILFLTLMVYSVIVSQSLMYLLSLKHAQLNLDAHAYIALRKHIDYAMNRTFRYVVYVALFVNLLLVVFTFNEPGSKLFIAALISFVCLVVDVILAVKGNLPINAKINTWTDTSYPENWQEARNEWLRFFSYRQIANITGFVVLIAAVIF